MAAPSAITELVRRFREQHDVYTSVSYSEAKLRSDFLDSFFVALGWDVHNTQGYAEAYREVIPEDSIKVGAFTKAPDYCFRIGGTRKFFVESKKPSVNVKDDLAPAFQVRRYAWSAKLPLSILTDFEEFAVYDCRVKPDKNDKASTARIMYLKYTEFETRWDEIASVFSKDAVLKGSFDKYAQAVKGKKGTTEVDAAFLHEIEGWREVLARNIALRNSQLSQRELNFAVQQTIDRIIFLRICEDRGMEAEGKLAATTNGANVYKRLCDLFRLADDKYNSGLFHFSKETGRDLPDQFTLALELDDKPLKDIIKGLYYPDCPYEFSVISSDILGQVYEQFLGKVIRLTDGHRAVVEDKPEVKKAGGVYYTPTYIVDYIVKNTVGKLLGDQGSGVRVQDKNEEINVGWAAPTKSINPKQASQLRILDPACGSGSFLIGAYQYLLDWHLQSYVESNPQKHATGKNPELYQSHSGDWKLTLAERKRILLDNIYGVDIDPQAVEVTKLSLLLKVLEGESDQTASGKQKLLHTRVLPDLDRNIKCGNSLIGPDFYKGQTTFLDNEEALRINVFDWKAEFPDIMKSGGFDAVIGNPPYIRVSNIEELWRPYLYKTYDVNHRFDIYIAFVQQAFRQLSSNGMLGFILPNKFFSADYGRGLRSFLSAAKAISDIVDFGDCQVFHGAMTYTCLLFLSKIPHKTIGYVTATTEKHATFFNEHPKINLPAEQFGEEPWLFVNAQTASLLRRLNLHPELGSICDIARGLETGADDIFFLQGPNFQKSEDIVSVASASESELFQIEFGAIRRLAKGSVDLRRYFIECSNRYLLFPYRHNGREPELITEKEFQAKFPLAWGYLGRHSGELKGRKGKHWYSFRRRNYDLQDGIPRLLIPSIGKRLSVACDDSGCFHFVGSGGGGGGGYGLSPKMNVLISLHYILGLLNSTLLDWVAKSINSRFSSGYYSFNRQYIEQLPIRTIDFSDPADKARHDRMVEMVEQMLALNKQLAATNTAHEKTALQRQIDATDHQIDQLVYELYGLTDEEIRIVEGC